MNTLNEIIKCKNDFEYFAENYLMIKTPVKGIAPFKLYDYQKNLVKNIKAQHFIKINKFRQGGFTTLYLAYIFWKCLFNFDTNIIYLTASKGSLNSAENIIKTFIDNLPLFLWPSNCAVFSKDYIKFENRSIIELKEFNSTGQIRGKKSQNLNIFIDEMAYMNNQKQLYDILFSFDRPIIIFSSTPKKK